MRSWEILSGSLNKEELERSDPHSDGSRIIEAKMLASGSRLATSVCCSLLLWSSTAADEVEDISSTRCSIRCFNILSRAC